MAYSVKLEVTGPMAIFTRPDTGGVPTTYPVPTWSACKGILEAIAFLREGAWFCPTQVEVCKRKGAPGGEISWQQYATNYGGPLRKNNVIQAGSSMQLFATVLSNVCYRIYADVLGDNPSKGRNPAHHLQELFFRRLRQGRVYRTPFLGWSEMVATYWGDFRTDEYEVDEDLNLDVPSMLLGVWSDPVSGVYAPRFGHVEVRAGRYTFDVSTRNGGCRAN